MWVVLLRAFVCFCVLLLGGWEDVIRAVEVQNRPYADVMTRRRRYVAYGIVYG
jgi:hypothetical protein